jgi:hypothetical protein
MKLLKSFRLFLINRVLRVRVGVRINAPLVCGVEFTEDAKDIKRGTIHCLGGLGCPDTHWRCDKAVKDWQELN